MKRLIFNFCLFFSAFLWAKNHHPEEFLASIQDKPNRGELIVEHFCSSCHNKRPLIELGAPKIGLSQDWEPRISQGLACLLKHTEEGFYAMPARGGCFECSEQELLLAILAMLPKVWQKNIQSNMESCTDEYERRGNFRKP